MRCLWCNYEVKSVPKTWCYNPLATCVAGLQRRIWFPCPTHQLDHACSVSLKYWTVLNLKIFSFRISEQPHPWNPDRANDTSHCAVLEGLQTKQSSKAKIPRPWYARLKPLCFLQQTKNNIHFVNCYTFIKRHQTVSWKLLATSVEKIRTNTNITNSILRSTSFWTLRPAHAKKIQKEHPSAICLPESGGQRRALKMRYLVSNAKALVFHHGMLLLHW